MAYPLAQVNPYYDELGSKWVYGPAHENFKEVLRYRTSYMQPVC